MNTSAFTQKPSKSKPEYVVVPDAAIQPLVDKLVVDAAALKKLEAATKEAKDSLKAKAFPFWLRHSHQHGLVSGAIINGTKPNSALVLFTNGWRSDVTSHMATIKKVVGQPMADECFKASTVLTVKAGDIPADKQDAFVKGLTSLCTSLGLDPAAVVQASSPILPIEAFNSRRVVELTIEQNLALEDIIATPASVNIRTKE